MTPYGCTTWPATPLGSVGTDDDTAAFAVATIATWWDEAARRPTPARGGC